MQTSNIVQLKDNSLDRALLIFGIQGESDLSDPVLKASASRLLFNVERIQHYVSEGLEDELLSMTHGAYRKSKGLGGDR